MSFVEAKKIFISYSWSSEEIKQKVLDLAKSLVADGIEVVLDRWDLEIGADKFSFMEQMVLDETIDRVLIISDRVYAEKSNSRQGGVGTETQIITPEIYRTTEKNRFIPIVFERDLVSGEAYLPIYAKSRMYIDLSDDAIFDEEYIRLVREIYEKPDLRKPKLGTTPSYILDERIDSFLVERKAKEVKRVFMYAPNRLSFLIKDFFDNFIQELDKLHVEKQDDEESDEAVVRLINQSLPFKQSIVTVMSIIAQGNEFDEILLDFFEDFNNKIVEVERSSISMPRLSSEVIKFLLNEIFIITHTILIKYRNWNSVSKLVNHFYYDYDIRKEVDFAKFRKPLVVIYEGNLEKKNKRVSLTADMMKNRASNEKEFEEMIEADLFLYYVSKINPNIDNDWYGIWFPALYIYRRMGNDRLKVLSLLKSNDNLKKILPVFNVTKEEFQGKMSEVSGERGYSNSFEQIPAIEKFLRKEEIGTRP
ncbi:toll/interleukin-1 receptor domain-containing protein [Enterococcus olivae]